MVQWSKRFWVRFPLEDGPGPHVPHSIIVGTERSETNLAKHAYILKVFKKAIEGNAHANPWYTS